MKAKVIHCIVSKDYNTGEIKTWRQEECKDFVKWSKNVSQFIMHNGVSFDAPILNRILGCGIQLNSVRDTLIESQLYDPLREGGHSLEKWGEKLNFPKGELNDYKEYNEDMLQYCVRDTELTWKVADGVGRR